MLIFALMAAGAVGLLLAWRLVVAGRVSVWTAMGTMTGSAGLASLATGRLSLSPKVAWGWSATAGVAAGFALYAATAAFVLIVRRWTFFDRHVEEIYEQRKGLPLPAALGLAAFVVGPGEELFWRGLFQWRLAATIGWPAAAILTWVVYVAGNAASQSLPILFGALVSGAVWGALALWTHGVLASLLCHTVWTGLMLVAPPGGAEQRTPIPWPSRETRRS
ncbi:MAG TPA: CPBP family intramembrane glutamic endopeptidase [Actinomycetota bacterium]